MPGDRCSPGAYTSRVQLRRLGGPASGCMPSGSSGKAMASWPCGRPLTAASGVSNWGWGVTAMPAASSDWGVPSLVCGALAAWSSARVQKQG